MTYHPATFPEQSYCKDCRSGRGENDWITLCPLHASAPDLLAVCKIIAGEPAGPYGISAFKLDEMLRAAIAKAEK
jgi:hypothetical protein